MNNQQNFPFPAWIFKLTGIVLILSFVVDFLILLFASQPRNSQWQVSLATAAVDRGLIPLIGLALIFAGYWIDSNTSDRINNRQSWFDLRLWAILSSLLGLFFLLLIPIHINNVNQASAQTIGRINQEAQQAETNLQTQINQLQPQVEQQQAQFKNQVQALLQNEQLFNQAIKSDRYSENEKKLLQQFKADPKALDRYLAQQAPATLANEKLNQIRSQRQELEQQARQEAWRSGLRVGIDSLLFAIAYVAIGWTGLRNTRSFRSSQPQSPAP
jgi:ABC-type multidrug transport system fused ATPase/permease subunit